MVLSDMSAARLTLGCLDHRDHPYRRRTDDQYQTPDRIWAQKSLPLFYDGLSSHLSTKSASTAVVSAARLADSRGENHRAVA
jgi:hypothetical protein